jgi:hypothetical protein
VPGPSDLQNPVSNRGDGDSSSFSRAVHGAQWVTRRRRGCLSSGHGLELRQQVAVDPALDRPPVESEAARRLQIAAAGGVDGRAVAAEDLLGGEVAGGELPGQLVSGSARPAGRRRAVLAADEDVAHALRQLPDVARPGVVAAQRALDPGLDLARERRRLVVADQALGEEEGEGRQLLGGVGDPLVERGGDDDVRAQAVVEVLAEAALPHVAAESRLVAAITLPRKRRSSVVPRRWKVRVSSTRRSLTWTAPSVSAISSRKTVPSGGQTSSQPTRSATAPVKAPRRWPKSWRRNPSSWTGITGGRNP